MSCCAAGAGAAALALARRSFGCGTASGPNEPRIVIVGAGLAGLSCAYRAAPTAGSPRTIYEANPDRIGGRCWTSRDWAGGQTAEHGGEFIDSRHRAHAGAGEALRARAHRPLRGPQPGQPAAVARTARCAGAPRCAREARGVPAPARARRAAASAATPPPTTPRPRSRSTGSRSPTGSTATSPAAAPGLWGRYVWAQMASEFGLDADAAQRPQPLLRVRREHAREPTSATTCSGGNDQIVARARRRAPGRDDPAQDAPLEALFERGDGSYGLRFGGVAGEVVADQVVLAIPFTTLRRVDLERSGLSARKRRCIDELGMGTNAKVLMQFDAPPAGLRRLERLHVLSDDPFLLTWESTLGEPGADEHRHHLLRRPLGRRRADRRRRPRARPLRARADAQPAPASRRAAAPGSTGSPPGSTAAPGPTTGSPTRGRAAPTPPSCPASTRSYYGYVGKPEGAIHFAGEHTATANQGYLEGAVESGERCADEILRAIL